MAYAFRCKTCNTLEDAANAGERDVPIKCRTCGAGVSFDKTGIRTEDPDNWIILASLDDKALAPILAYHAIDKSEIETHTPIPAASPGHVPVSLHVVASESNTSEDQS